MATIVDKLILDHERLRSNCSRRPSQSSKKVENPSRRRFLRSTARNCVGALALGFIAADSMALARPAKVSENEAFARQLKYLEDASQEKASAYQKGQTCANCVFYKNKQGSQWGPCQIFGGRLVNANGWCTAYRAVS